MVEDTDATQGGVGRILSAAASVLWSGGAPASGYEGVLAHPEAL